MVGGGGGGGWYARLVGDWAALWREGCAGVTPLSDRYRLVVLGIDRVQLRQTGEVAAHEHLQVLSLRLALLAVLRLAALHADPEAVHLNEVAQNAVHAVVDVAAVLAAL